MLELKNVTKAYPVRKRRKGWFSTQDSEQAVKKVSLELRQGSVLDWLEKVEVAKARWHNVF